MQKLLLLRVELDYLQSGAHVHDPEVVLRPPDEVFLAPLYDLDALLELLPGDVLEFFRRFLDRRQFFDLHNKILYDFFGFDELNAIN